MGEQNETGDASSARASLPPTRGTVVATVIAIVLAAVALVVLVFAIRLMTTPSGSPYEDNRPIAYLGLWLLGTWIPGVVAFGLALGARLRARTKGRPLRGVLAGLGVAAMIVGLAYPLYLIALPVWSALT
ncbi:hypothetical protein [Microbacterium gorillae]|uniref:hypothetical protein n=1 Tax=Microbacterium gorillae TaxID=1231063 RepID=UPI00058F9478|nr:hypothetical protein [Microbacterium gorillae]